LKTFIFRSGVKTDFTAGLLRRAHQFSEGIGDFLQVLIVSQGFAFQRLDFASQFVHGQEHSAHSDESAHDFDVDGDGARTAQNTGKHDNAFLGKGIGQIPASAAPV
jgi:hypothetical protein